MHAAMPPGAAQALIVKEPVAGTAGRRGKQARQWSERASGVLYERSEGNVRRKYYFCVLFVWAGGRLAAPGAAEGCFQAAGEGLFIAQGGNLHVLTDGSAEVGEAGEVAGEGEGFVDILLGGMGQEFGVADGREDRQPSAGDVRLADEGDDGEAHEEGIAGGGVAVVGEGIEGDVGGMVLAEVGQALGAANEVEAGWGKWGVVSG
jgi:hypothetical protein